MSTYIHHVPGRLRVRSSSFRCHSPAARIAHERLMAVDGVTQVRINPRARSITVNYDPARLTRSQLLTLLEECGCVETAAQTASTLGTKAGEAFGKALIGAVVNKAIERSAVKFVSLLL